MKNNLRKKSRPDPPAAFSLHRDSFRGAMGLYLHRDACRGAVGLYLHRDAVRAATGLYLHRDAGCWQKFFFMGGDVDENGDFHRGKVSLL